ncbi:MAG: threonylcarbamoyl-AMP synthase [Dehalococcoidia bacterium]|nr:threonylcarbamoyl-AMP synthase [Dehalococcoidia bacterium]
MAGVESSADTTHGVGRGKIRPVPRILARQRTHKKMGGPPRCYTGGRRTIEERQRVLLMDQPLPPVVEPSPGALAQAVLILRSGGVVVFPTETVYGIGADPWSESAVQDLYAAKGRDDGKPLQLLLGSADAIEQVAMVAPDVLEAARRFMPGGLTLVLRAGPRCPLSVRAGGATVGVRVPDHPVALELIKQFGRPLAATSANRSGHPSPTTAAGAVAQLGSLAGLVIDGGPCSVGKDSTVLDLSGARPLVLREGAVTREALARAFGPLGARA